jgi:hypothetical protein
MVHYECFGVLEIVFPLGEDGMREVPQGCAGCAQRVACMKAALASEEGIRFREDRVERLERSGMIGWLERWSRKKELSRLSGSRQGRK